MVKFTTEGLAEQIAGSRYAVETSNDVIKDWSPNNVRGVFIGLGDKGVFVDVVQYLGKTSRRVLVPNEFRSKTVPALNLMFQRRKYSCLEFFCWDSNISEVGINPSKTLQYLKGCPVLSAVGATNGYPELTKDGVISQGATEITENGGVSDVYFQPATYALDVKLKDKFESIKKSVNGSQMLEREFEGENLSTLENFSLFLDLKNNTKLDFHNQMVKSFNETVAKHKLGLGKKELQGILLDKVNQFDEDKVEIFLKALGELDPCFKNGVSEYSETVLDLGNFCVGWLPRLEFEMKDTIGAKMVDLYLNGIQTSKDLFGRLWVLLKFEEYYGG